MRIRMLHNISGTRDGVPWPDPGEVVDLPDDEALTLLRTRMATHVETPAVAETATTRRKATTRRTPATD